MKQETRNALLTARALFDKAQEFCTVDDKYLASAGLVILQDAFELVLYSCLLELDADNNTPIESMSFDALISELRKRGKPIAKSGTLKALNKARVIIKHYGQVAEPASVLVYFNAAKSAADILLKDIIGNDLQQILLSDAIKDEVIREHVSQACNAIEEKQYFEALVETRKAIYIAIEQDYSVYDWKDFDSRNKIQIFDLLNKGGSNASWNKKNKDWIRDNVKNPFEYIQIDHERLRIDLLEWGVSTQDFWNIWRLTPSVFYNKESQTWLNKLDLQHAKGGATEGNARYCVDRAVSLLIKKQSHIDLSRQLEYGPEYTFRVKMKCDQPLYDKASKESEVQGILNRDKSYNAESIVVGLIENERYVRITHIQEEEPKWLVGYVLLDFCEIEDD